MYEEDLQERSLRAQCVGTALIGFLTLAILGLTLSSFSMLSVSFRDNVWFFSATILTFIVYIIVLLLAAYVIRNNFDLFEVSFRERGRDKEGKVKTHRF
ncbi:MAG: hypothetical protein JW778_06015 [Candidatus Altiarchaeota archaeon]|nr:hypothetical protein [Candidatus Altiarchaeota archaeon]